MMNISRTYLSMSPMFSVGNSTKTEELGAVEKARETLVEMLEDAPPKKEDKKPKKKAKDNIKPKEDQSNKDGKQIAYARKLAEDDVQLRDAYNVEPLPYIPHAPTDGVYLVRTEAEANTLIERFANHTNDHRCSLSFAIIGNPSEFLQSETLAYRVQPKRYSFQLTKGSSNMVRDGWLWTIPNSAKQLDYKVAVVQSQWTSTTVRNIVFGLSEYHDKQLFQKGLDAHVRWSEAKTGLAKQRKEHGTNTIEY